MPTDKPTSGASCHKPSDHIDERLDRLALGLENANQLLARLTVQATDAHAQREGLLKLLAATLPQAGGRS